MALWDFTSLLDVRPWEVFVLLTCLVVILRQRKLNKRLDSHSRSIGYIDDWANVVDAQLLEFENWRSTANTNSLYSSPQLLDLIGSEKTKLGQPARDDVSSGLRRMQISA
jgi:hypothetical protein